MTSANKISGSMETAKLPLGYFVLPLALSFNTPFSIFGLVVGTIAAITDPVCRQLPEINWFSLVVLTVLSIGFVGMCYCQKWALWLIVIQQTIWIVMAWIALCEPGFRQDWLVLLIMSIYCLLIVASCLYALWRCSHFGKDRSTAS